MKVGRSAWAGRVMWLFARGSLSGGIASYVPIVLANRGVSFGRQVVLIWLFSGAGGEYGLAMLALLLTMTLMALASLGLPETASRFVSRAAQGGALAGFLLRWGVGSAGVSTVVCVLLWMMAPWLGDVLYSTVAAGGSSASSAVADPMRRMGLVGWTVVCIWSQLGYLLLLGLLKGLGMVRAVIGLEVLHTVVYTSLLLGAVLLGGREAEWVLAAYAASLLGCCAAMWPGFVWAALLLDRRADVRGGAGGRGADVERSGRSVWGFAVCMAVAGLCWQLLVSLPDRFVLLWVGEEALGSFAAVRQIAQMLAVLAVAVNTVLLGVVFGISAEGDAGGAAARWDRCYRLTMSALTLVGVLLSALGPVVGWMFPGAFRDGMSVWGVSLAGYLLQGHVSFLYVRLGLSYGTFRVLLTYVAGLACWLALGPWLVRGYGIEGAALGATLSLSVVVAGGLGLLRLWGERVDSRCWWIALGAWACVLSAPWWAGCMAVALGLIALRGRLWLDGGDRKVLVDAGVDLLRRIRRR